MNEELKLRLQTLAQRPLHRFIKRDIFFCHRDLDLCLKDYEEGKTFYLYTGRGPSAESMHLGHCIPFIMCQWLQEVLDLAIVIQITDDEKYIHKSELELEQTTKMGFSNIKDIIAFGFNPAKTFIFMDSQYISYMYENILKVSKNITLSQIKGVFGFIDSDNLGKFAFPQPRPFLPSATPSHTCLARGRT